MSFTAHLNAVGLGPTVDVFTTRAGFEHQGMPLAAAFNPAFTITASGAMLAFAEGRLGATHDDAPKTVILNRSEDLGRTWQGIRALTLPANHFGPRPYTMRKQGRELVCVLVTLSLYHLREQYPDLAAWPEQFGIDPDALRPDSVTVALRLVSADDGHTWEIDALTGDRDPFPFPAPGSESESGSGAAAGTSAGRPWVGFSDFTGTVETIPAGPHAGRRFIAVSAMGLDPYPQTHPPSMRHVDRLGSGVMISDDGETWRLGGIIADRRGNEAAAAVLQRDQTIALLRRPNGFTLDDLQTPDRIVGLRMLHRSTDGGETWSAPVFPEGLPYLKQDGRRYDFHCLPSLCAWDNTLITAQPSAVDRELGKTHRTHGVVGFSDDMGLTWRHRLIDQGDFSYATLNRVGDEGVIVMFSRGNHGEQSSCLRAFTLDWLRNA